ncbi:MAG: UDP-N-acetylmuramoyl-tripeptide--D-alanyl-D-alanine ligase [Ignavibacteriaceae bacterium]|nr:UDP-N-acetylmuramoyl-tripeptide--D-alanyl-D-alanine ligase [Ignavibacteriaceae bacterium]HRN27034.1 UDP-N-acetylmuramoyl-tripeptide--D-alanyl-D-alanine ligase [Ignavibacteriaceae bacterium]HRQ54652.1 UDP-N-acetylmuramoyl-tripeptide--D-alanyl-D-alanine ligase [Ignavibacteriaceae bacterium]
MKKIHLNIEDIFNIPTAVIYNPDMFKSIYHVSINSRNIKKNSLFIAIKGERFDGHDFINEVVKRGASAIVINEKKFKKINDLEIPVITVKDTTLALGEIAKLWRAKLKTKIIGITGSAGKTTTKEILAALLSEKFKVNKTVANNNNHIGVPLTILSTNEKHQVLVAELGTNHFGEIPYSAVIASPDLALITNIGDSHLEYLKNRNGVFKEKSALFNETLKRTGKVFINNDDKILKEFGKTVKGKVTFALKEKADYKAIIKGYDKFAKPQIEIGNKKKSFAATLPLSGEKNVLNFTAAFAIASELGLTNSQIQKAVKKIKSYNKRLEIKNYKTFTLIDDTYNANPDSMKSALEILDKIESRKKKIAVLGDMFELGSEAKLKHIALASFINKTNVDEVYSIGKMMKLMNQKLNEKIKVQKHFADREMLKRFLKSLDINNSAILIKGSRGMKMEEFVSIIESTKY